MHMQAMRMPRFHSEISSVVKHNIASIRKIQDIEFERHYLSCETFYWRPRGRFWPSGGGAVGSKGYACL